MKSINGACCRAELTKSEQGAPAPDRQRLCTAPRAAAWSGSRRRPRPGSACPSRAPPLPQARRAPQPVCTGTSHLSQFHPSSTLTSAGNQARHARRAQRRRCVAHVRFGVPKPSWSYPDWHHKPGGCDRNHKAGGCDVSTNQAGVTLITNQVAAPAGPAPGEWRPRGQPPAPGLCQRRGRGGRPAAASRAVRRQRRPP